GGEFVFSEKAIVAITGSDFGGALDGAPVPPYATVEARAQQKLRFGPTRSGARCYLCVEGGIAGQAFLGSLSRHLLSGLGGHEGRALRKGDVLPLGDASQSFRRRRISADVRARLAPGKSLRVTEGPQSSSFPESAKKLFFEQEYLVTEETNR